MATPTPKPVKKGRRNPLNAADQRILKKIGLRISADLYKHGLPVEWLAFRVGIARSSIREIIAGRSNPRFLTLKSIVEGLGYKTLYEFLRQL